MTCRVDTAPLIAGACVVSLYPGHGVRGDAVPSTGTHGPSPVYNDLTLPADAAKEYRWAITSPPGSGTLVVYEDCSYAYTPPGGTTDLTVHYTYRLWQDGVDMGTAVETIVIGAGSGSSYVGVAASMTVAAAMTAGAGTYTAAGSGPAYVGVAASMTAAATMTAGTGTYTVAVPSDWMEPITVSQAKLAARLDPLDTTLDSVVEGYISTARLIAEHETGREYVRKTKRYTFDDWPASTHVMHMHQPSSVAVSYWDGTQWAPMTDGSFAWAEVDNGFGIAPLVGASWPTLGDVAIGARVRVDAVAGSATATADTPENVKTFLKACVAFWVDNPAEGASGSLAEAPRLGRLLDPDRLWGM